MHQVTRIAFMSLALAGAGAALAPRAHATSCDPARAMIVLDKSSSMNGTIAGKTKWEIARTAIDGITSQFETKIDLGLMTFPRDGACSPGDVDIDTQPMQHDEIAAALGEPPPAAGNWTPMAQTLDVAVATASLQDAQRQRYVVLITDGWQWCSPYDPSTRFAPVDSVAALNDMGVKTFVVGFGGEVDSLTLNKMAVMGGTAPEGCDPATTGSCYYQADNAAQLTAALDAIAVQVSAEICDGQDNDCDGQIDEELTQACTSACGSGTETCSFGTWAGCDAPPVMPEVCDGSDNDCDGAIDPGCVTGCTAGETRACEGESTGACEPGVQTCGDDGAWSDCAGAVPTSDETCNGIDDDCDGDTDELGGPPLCASGESCVDGSCQPDQPADDPPNEEDPTADPETGPGTAGTGCACEVGGSTGGSPLGGLVLGVLAVLGLVVARRRR
jgi:MYXO-CTERM domain-containing protein